MIEELHFGQMSARRGGFPLLEWFGLRPESSVDKKFNGL